MAKLQILRKWLLSSGLLGELLTDELGKRPPCASLRPEGLTMVWEKQDVLGVRTRRWRLNCVLQARLLHPAREDAQAQADTWLALQQWAAQTAPPELGKDTTVSLEQGKLAYADGTGTAIYTAGLVAEFSITS